MIHLVTKSRRKLTTDIAKKMAQSFKLSPSETKYFINLVGLKESLSLVDRELFAHGLVKDKSSLRIDPLRSNQYGYYSNWYNIVIREILAYAPKAYLESELANLIVPKISEKQVKDSLDLMNSLGLISYKNNQWVVSNQVIGFADSVAKFSLMLFHKKMIELGGFALEKFDRTQRDITGITASLSETEFAKAQVIIENARHEILKLSESKEPEKRIFQMNVQLFPVSQRIKK